MDSTIIKYGIEFSMRSAGMIVLLLMTVFINREVMSATIDCHDMELKAVAVQGPRDDKHVFQNKLVLKLAEPCAGMYWVHADVDDSAFAGFLSVALSAQSMGRKVAISVNTSETTGLSNRIAYIAIVNE